MNSTKMNIVERMKHYNVAGLSIVKIENGQISNEEYFGLLESGTDKNVNSESIFNACSISKFLTSMLVMKLTAQGILDLDEDVNKRLSLWKVPENGLTTSKKITLRNLLSHQSGIIDPEGSFTELIPMNGYPSMVDLLLGRTHYCGLPIEVHYEPESDFQYSDAGYCVIQHLIEEMTEKPFHVVMKEQIFNPLLMKNSTVEMTISDDIRNNISCGHDKNGELVDGKYPIYPYPAASGLWTTSSDLAILVIELMNALKGESKLGISASHAKEIISSQGCKEWTGLGVFLDGAEKELEMSSLGWGMGFQSMLVTYPYLESGLVIMTNSDLGVHQMKGIIGEIYHYQFETFLNQDGTK